MFKKFTFEKKLGIDSTKKEFKGIKISTLSFLVALAGILISLYVLEPLGTFIFYIGGLGVVVGIIMTISEGIKRMSKNEKI